MSVRALAAIEAGAAAPGTLAGLQRALKARMETIAERFPLLETKTDTRAPNVIDGWLGPKENADAEEFPFLAVRARTGTDSEQGADQNARATFVIVIGTYSDEDDGWLDVMMIVDAIRDDLAAAPVLEHTAFEHVGPLTWEIEDPPRRPQWLGVVNTIWQLPRPQRVEARNPEG